MYVTTAGSKESFLTVYEYDSAILNPLRNGVIIGKVTFALVDKCKYSVLLVKRRMHIQTRLYRSRLMVIRLLS